MKLLLIFVFILFTAQIKTSEADFSDIFNITSFIEWLFKDCDDTSEYYDEEDYDDSSEVPHEIPATINTPNPSNPSSSLAKPAVVSSSLPDNNSPAPTSAQTPTISSVVQPVVINNDPKVPVIAPDANAPIPQEIPNTILNEIPVTDAMNPQ